MTDKPLQRMKRAELIELIETHISALEIGKENADRINNQCSKIHGIENEMNTIQSNIRDKAKAIHTIHVDVAEEQETIDKIKDDVEANQADINDFHDQLFGSESDDGEEIIGIQEEIKNFQNEQEEKFKTLEQEIKNLLPGATAAGLASSLAAGKKEHRDNPLMWGGFILSLIVLTVLYASVFFEHGSASVTWETILFRTTLGFPLMWFAWFCQRAISNNKRIREEYHHKERVMLMYDGLRKYITNLPAEGQLTDLTRIILNTVARNPAIKIETPKTLIEAIQQAIRNAIAKKNQEDSD